MWLARESNSNLWNGRSSALHQLQYNTINEPAQHLVSRIDLAESETVGPSNIKQRNQTETSKPVLLFFLWRYSSTNFNQIDSINAETENFAALQNSYTMVVLLFLHILNTYLSWIFKFSQFIITNLSSFSIYNKKTQTNIFAIFLHLSVTGTIGRIGFTAWSVIPGTTPLSSHWIFAKKKWS